MRSASPSRSEKYTILLVDDNCDGLDARRAVLQELGYTVLSACCGFDALKMVEQQTFDLIITDFKMLPMDGLELITALRSREFKSPIILLTGFADMLGLRKESTGADVVLRKSANEIADLVRAVRHMLNRSKKPAGKQTLERRKHAAG